MKELFIVREKVNHFIREYETWFLIIAKFIGMMFVFTYVNSELGYFEILNSISVNVLLSLICSILPGSFSVFIVAAVIMAHMVKLSVLLAMLVLVVMVILYLLFLKFASDQSAVLLAVPVLMQYDMHYLIPVLAGMFFTPYAVVPAVIGLFMVKFLKYTCEASAMTGTGMSFNLDGMIAVLNSIIGQITVDRDVWLYAIIGVATMSVIFVIRQFSFDYAWYVAIAAGGVTEIIATFLCAAALGVDVRIVSVIIGTAVGVLLAVVLQFMKCAVDYSRKEYVQFEDDDYYYYVKAIPKISVSQPEMNTVKLNIRKKTVKTDTDPEGREALQENQED